jgi:hypothetical protein
LREQQTSAVRAQNVEVDPERHFAAIKYRTAKGPDIDSLIRTTLAG